MITPHEIQRRELRRTSSTIGDEIISYCRGRIGREIAMSQLQDYVIGRIKTTQCCTVQASSVDRVFRDLRSSGVIEYTCTSRSGSKYRIDYVKPLAL